MVKYYAVRQTQAFLEPVLDEKYRLYPEPSWVKAKGVSRPAWWLQAVAEPHTPDMKDNSCYSDTD